MLTVGTTEFTLPIVSRAWNRVSEEFRQREVEFKVAHVRTKDVWSRLENRQVDLVCGSIVSTPEGDLRLKEYEVIEYARGQALLLTNLPEHELPDMSVETSGLGRVPLVVPPAGLVADLLATWYGTNFRDRLNVVADIDDVHYGLSLLRSGFVRGCMIVTGSIGRGMAAQEDPDAVPLRAFGLHDDLEPKAELMTGAFVRRADLERYDAGHPLNRLWAAVKQDVRTYTPWPDPPRRSRYLIWLSTTSRVGRAPRCFMACAARRQPTVRASAGCLPSSQGGMSPATNASPAPVPSMILSTGSAATVTGSGRPLV